MQLHTKYQYKETFFKVCKPVNSMVYHVEFFDKNDNYLHTDYSRTINDIKNTYNL